MEKVKRMIFFWALVVLFLITTPIIVFNARGYRFDTDRGVFVYGGAITLKTNPQAVNVSLNGDTTDSKKLNRINNSYNITGLLPADYNIEISAKGFQTWSKKIDVHSGIASEFWNVLLVRDNYIKTEIETKDIEKFFISPKNKFLTYIQKNSTGFTLKVMTIEDEIEELSIDFPEWKLFNELKTENIEWSTNESYLSIPVQKSNASLQYSSIKEETGYLIIDLETKKSIYLNDLVKKEDVKNFRWNSEDDGYFFFMHEQKLFRANIENENDLLEVASDISSFDISGTYLYYTKIDNNLLFKKTFNGEGEPIQITSSFPEEKCDPISKIIVYDDSRIILISKNKDLYIFNQGEHANYFRKLDSRIIDARFSNDGKKLLFWSDNEISVYFVRDEISQPAQEENEMQNITRFSKPLENIQWFSDYEHVIFKSEKTIKIIELDPRDKINCMDIINIELENSNIVYNESLKKLYFTDKNNDFVSLYSIDFPEETSFFQ